MKKASSGGIKDILIKCGFGFGILMLIFSTVVSIMMLGTMKKIKHKMEDAQSGMEALVDKFKKAGEGYSNDIDALKKDVAGLKGGSPSKSDDKASKKDTSKSDDKKSDDKSDSSKKSDDSAVKPDDSKKSDDKAAKHDDSKHEDPKKADDKDAIGFKDDKDAKTSDGI